MKRLFLYSASLSPVTILHAEAGSDSDNAINLDQEHI